MFKTLTFFSGLVIALFMCKATGTTFFGRVPSWFAVFSPWIAQGIVSIFQAYAISKGWDIKIDAWLWRAALRFRVFFIRRDARKEFKKDVAKRANPGQFVDPQNLGK